jgi:hypothetical protein
LIFGVVVARDLFLRLVFRSNHEGSFPPILGVTHNRDESLPPIFGVVVARDLYLRLVFRSNREGSFPPILGITHNREESLPPIFVIKIERLCVPSSPPGSVTCAWYTRCHWA